MIDAEIFRNSRGLVTGFSVKNHGEGTVCAAVSMLVLNTVNSIEVLTEDDFFCEYNDNGGNLKFSLSEPDSQTPGMKILLDAMILGLESVREQHPEELCLRVTQGNLLKVSDFYD